MVKWGKRLLGRVKASSRRSRNEKGHGKHTSYYDKREYDSSDDLYSQGSYDEDYYEEEGVGWDARDDVDDTREEDYDDDEDDEDIDDEYGENDGSESELVTRDQVLDELKAQAAAEALGKSLEQMGYNLDNCDSFYSLSENEGKDQRYNISQRNSEVSGGQKSGSTGRHKKKRGKIKKKRTKSSRSRYASDEDDEASSTYYGNYSGARHHSFGDYETHGNSSSDASEDDSYYEDETTFTTGRDSAVTGKTSRYSRFTGKKSGRTRKSKSRKHKRHARDHDTYCSRGTEWSPDASSYGKTLDQNSTFSSVSSSEDSDLDLNTAYTEPTRKHDRRRKKESSRHAKTDKRKRNMRAIDEKQAPSENELSEDSFAVGMKRKNKKKQTKQSLIARRRSDSSRLSKSSQIVAMRSWDTISDNESAQKDVKGDRDNEESQRDAAGKKKHSRTDSKNSKLSEEPSSSGDKDETSEETSKNNGHTKKLLIADSQEDAAEDNAEPEAEVVSDLSDAEGRKSAPQKNGRSGKQHEPEESNDIVDKKKRKKKDVFAEKHEKRQSNASKAGPNSDEDAATSDSDGSTYEKPASGDVHDKPKNGKSSKAKKGAKVTQDEETPESGNQRKDSKKSVEKGRSKRTRKSLPVRKGGAPYSTLHARPSEPANSSKKFWPRQFLSLRKKKHDDNRQEAEEEKEAEERKRVVEEPGDILEKIDNVDKADGKKRRKSDDAKHSRRANQERSVSRERSASRDSREQCPSPERSQRDALSPRRKDREKRNPSEHKKQSYKEVVSSQEVIAEAPESVDPSSPKSSKEEEGMEKPRTSSSGSIGMLEMAAMIPLAPLAAAYSCYTAKHTQSFITNGSACVDRTCKDAQQLKCTKLDSEDVKEPDGDDHTRASKKKRPTSKKQEGATLAILKGDDENASLSMSKRKKSKPKNQVDSNIGSDEENGGSSKKKKSKDRKPGDSIIGSDNLMGKKNRTKPKKQEHSNIGSDDEIGSLRSLAASKKSAKAENHEIIEKEIVVTKTPKASGSRGKTETRASSRSKKALTKILPQRTSKYDLPKTHIQEAPEGFESFLPGSLEAQCLSMSDTATLTSQTLSLIMQQPTRPVASGQPTGNSESKAGRKKSKRWMPKLPFGSHKKDDDKADLNEHTEQAGPNATHPILDDIKTTQNKPSRVHELSLSFLNKIGKNENGNLSTRALTSFWAETPAFASPKNKAGVKKKQAKPKPQTSLPPDGEIEPFACTRSSTVCGQVDEGETGDLEMDRSLLSDFENIALEALRKKSEKEAEDSGPALDPSKATQEDLLKYYDLGQTLSDVIDARQTLEQAYGVHSGGNSFDHTIDEQLVELLTHMAEMDQDDVVEIEAAIKKLKRHARKLGISERDLLFSVKSAEESARSLNGDDQDNVEEPSSFSEKMIGAFEGYFGKRE